MIILRLPIPPSTNGLYYNRRKGNGRGKTKNYRNWIKEADKWGLIQKIGKIEPIAGPCKIEMRVPKTRSDASNLIKAAEDWLVSRKITGDDRNNFHVSIVVDEALVTREMWITVRAA